MPGRGIRTVGPFILLLFLGLSLLSLYWSNENGPSSTGSLNTSNSKTTQNSQTSQKNQTTPTGQTSSTGNTSPSNINTNPASSNQNGRQNSTQGPIAETSPQKTSTKLQFLEQALQQQEYFCQRTFPAMKDFIPYQLRENIRVAGVSFDFYAYASNDYVSSQILRGKGFALKKTATILNILDKIRVEKSKPSSQVVYVSIGSGIGWFPAVAAYKGYKVISFEPMSSNEMIQRMNICLMNLLGTADNWILFNKAVGNKEQKCKIVSDDNNVGNGMVMCQGDPLAGYSSRGMVNIVTLDSILTEEMLGDLTIGIVTIDVEDFVKAILQGGLRFFSSNRVKYMMMQFSPMEDQDAVARNQFVYDTLTTLGWQFSVKDFEGEPIDPIYLNAGDQTDVYMWK